MTMQSNPELKARIEAILAAPHFDAEAQAGIRLMSIVTVDLAIAAILKGLEQTDKLIPGVEAEQHSMGPAEREAFEALLRKHRKCQELLCDLWDANAETFDLAVRGEAAFEAGA